MFVISTTGGTASNWLSEQFCNSAPSCVCTHGGYMPSTLPPGEVNAAESAILQTMEQAGTEARIREAHKGFEEVLQHRSLNTRRESEANILACLQVMEKTGTGIAGDIHGFSHPASGELVEKLGGHFAYLMRDPITRTISKLRLKYDQIHEAKALYDRNQDGQAFTKLFQLVLNPAFYYVDRAERALNIAAYTKTNTAEKLVLMRDRLADGYRFRYAGGLSGNHGFRAMVRISGKSDGDEEVRLFFEPNEMLLLTALIEINIGVSADREFHRLKPSSKVVRFEDLTKDRTSLKDLIDTFTGGKYRESNLSADAFVRKLNTRAVAPTAEQLKENFPDIMQFVADATEFLTEQSGLEDFYRDLGYSKG